MPCPRSLHGPGAWYKVPIGGGNRDTAKTAARFACQRTPTKKCEGTMKLRARYLLSAVAALALAGGIAAADAAEMRMGLALEPSSIDPHYHNLGPHNALSAQPFNALLQTDETKRQIGQPARRAREGQHE